MTTNKQDELTPNNQTPQGELRKALSKDFHALLVREFTSDWMVQRMVRDLEIDVMSLDHVQSVVNQEVRQVLDRLEKQHVTVGRINIKGIRYDTKSVPYEALAAERKRYNV